MSSYRRFVAYVYRFQDGKKGNNCGFVKVEARNGICTFYFRIQGLDIQGPCRLLAFVRKETGHDFILLSQADVKNGLLHHRVDTDRLHIGGSGYTLDQCAGLLCIGEGGEYYGGGWDKDAAVPDWRRERPDLLENTGGEEREKSQERVEILPEESEPPAMQAADCKAEKENPGKENCAYKREWIEAPDGKMPLEEPEECPKQEESCTEKEAKEQAEEERPGTFQEVWAYMQQEFPQMDPFEDGGVVEGIKIAPSDIPYLQERKWNLGSNQFLLHGYKNYHHLMLGRIEGQNRYIIGIPGVYDQQEQFMAKMFGFPCFKPVRRCRNRNGQFGYWFRCIC